MKQYVSFCLGYQALFIYSIQLALHMQYLMSYSHGIKKHSLKKEVKFVPTL